MKIEFDNGFFKSLKKLNNPSIQKNINKVIDVIEKAIAISDIPNLKKMAGYQDYYRIRIGDYRLGISVNNHTVLFVIIGHRKDIYDIFP